MATSRTATAKWKSLRRRALHRAQAQGITHCPIKGCGVPLDYSTGTRPNSATPDHIKHHALGGTDTLDNIRIICRRCNSIDGAKLGNAITRKRTPQRVTNIDFAR